MTKRKGDFRFEGFVEDVTLCLIDKDAVPHTLDGDNSTAQIWLARNVKRAARTPVFRCIFVSYYVNVTCRAYFHKNVNHSISME